MPDDATAFGGSRSTQYIVNIVALADTPATLEADRAWARAFWSELVPYAQGVGSYVNFMTEFEADRVRASYGAAKYDRLAAVKATPTSSRPERRHPALAFRSPSRPMPRAWPSGEQKQPGSTLPA